MAVLTKNENVRRKFDHSVPARPLLNNWQRPFGRDVHSLRLSQKKRRTHAVIAARLTAVSLQGYYFGSQHDHTHCEFSTS